MKKIYSLAIAASVAVGLNAQTFTQGEEAVVLETYNVSKKLNGAKTPTDTSGWSSTNFLPNFASSSNQAINWGYTGGGKLFGVNISAGQFTKISQGYTNFNATPVCIEEVLMWVADKKPSGAGTSVQTVNVYNMAANQAHSYNGSAFVKDKMGPSGSALATQTITYNQLDTANLFTIVSFPTSAKTSGDFALELDFTQAYNAGDTFGLIGDSQGDAAGLDYAFHYISANVANGPGWYCTSHVFTASSQPLDNNIAMWAVLEYNCVSSIGEEFDYVNGMQLAQNYPNPANGITTIEYALQNASENVKLEIFDLTGKTIEKFEYASQAAGSYKVNVDTYNMPVGTYYFRLSANGKNITKKLMTVK